MIVVADRIYTRILEGLALLWENPIACSAVGLVQKFIFLVLLVLAAGLLLEVVALWRIRKSSTPWTDTMLLDRYRQYAERFRLRRLPPLFVASEDGPLVFTSGYLRPSIGISNPLVNRLDEQELRAVLCHELAHVERRDNLSARATHLLSILGVTLVPAALALSSFFSNPTLHFGSFSAKLLGAGSLLLILVTRHLVWRPLMVSREISCDDRAIEAGAEPLSLAAALAKTWQLQHHGAGGRTTLAGAQTLLPFDARVERRIERLIDYEPPSRLPGFAARAMSVIFLAGIIFVVVSHHI